MTIGIRREDKNEWERRVPLTPTAVGQLVAEGKDVIVQPSTLRVFPDEDYRAAGARVQEDLSTCSLVLAVKEIPSELFTADTAYIFFSHTIKGQAYNMPMLRRMMQQKCQLFDYERVADEKGRRLIFFGRFAGVAGMIDTLWAFAQRLKSEAASDLFAGARRAYEYASIEQAHAHIATMGEQIRQGGVPRARRPLVCGITGYGNVSQGAQEVLDLLPVETVSPETLADRFDSLTDVPDRIFKVVFKEEHLVEPRNPQSTFELQDYYDHPERYRSRFESYLPYLTMLINCIYWEPRYPRLVTRAYLERAWGGPEPPRLSTMGDISCDIEGSIECTVKATDPGHPVYVYEPGNATIRDGWEGAGPVIMAVDNLPCELPRNASEEFSRALSPFVAALARAHYDRPFSELLLPAEFKRAMILHRGELTPDYQFMQQFLR